MPHHQRIVLGIHHGTTSRDFMRDAAEMARLLGLEIFGVFVEDEAVHGLASMPFVRELRLPSHEWHPIDPDRVAAEFRHAASTAKRLLDTVAQGLGVRSTFEVRRGDPSGVVADLLCSSDIVVLGEPKLGSDELTQAFLRAWRTACGSDASVLLLPPGPMRRRGPVIALLAGDSDRGVLTAAHIARIAHEPLVLLGAPDRRRAAAVNLPTDRIRGRDLADVSENTLRFTLAEEGERLLVLDRDGLQAEQEAAVLRVAAARGTPVLLVGPAAEPPVGGGTGRRATPA
jgi:hypothetical protein